MRLNVQLKRMHEFNLALANDKATAVNVSPVGSCRRISLSSSAMAYSATGFLFTFFIQPMSNTKLTPLRDLSFFSAAKPGAGSTLIVAGGPSSGCNPKKSAGLNHLKGYYASHSIQATGMPCFRWACGLRKFHITKYILNRDVSNNRVSNLDDKSANLAFGIITVRRISIREISWDSVFSLTFT